MRWKNVQLSKNIIFDHPPPPQPYPLQGRPPLLLARNSSISPQTTKLFSRKIQQQQFFFAVLIQKGPFWLLLDSQPALLTLIDIFSRLRIAVSLLKVNLFVAVNLNGANERRRVWFHIYGFSFHSGLVTTSVFGN